MKIDGSSYYYYDEKQRLEESRFNYDYRIDYNTNAFTSVYVAYGNYYNEDDTLKAYSIGFFDHYGKYRISYTYDDFNRLSKKDVEINELKPELNNDKGVLSTIEYAYKTENGVTSALVEEYLTTVYIKTGSDHLVSAIEQWNYVYDNVGNIIAVKNDDIDVVSYEYDSLGQLTRENNALLGKTYTYSYDNYGNLTSVKTYNYTTGALTGTAMNTDTYTYSNGDWGDQLVSFNGQTITYDQMGNPTTYLGATLSWENIRQLASYVKGNTNVSYTYNVDGIRTSKTVNGVTHTYALEDTRILLETYGTVLIVYLYDEEGSPIGLAYRDSATANTTLDKEEQFTYYLFTKNLQGDIISIYNEQGQIVTLYRYDTWGNHTVHNWTDDNIGNINPFRYRGYYYDTDTGFYYLNSRYYDPQVKRFINADDISYLGANGDLQGFNLYAYCSNNPVMYTDPSGNWIIFATLVAVLLFTPVGGVATQVATSIVSYVGVAVTSIFDEDVRNDMNAIGWNPFNSDESATVNSSKVSFYKGAPVFKTELDRPGSFYAIFLNESANETTLKHERGHNTQSMIMGTAKSAAMILLPSWQQWSNRSYYERPWEVTADVFGGVTARSHSQENINRGFWYLGVSTFFGAAGYFFLLGEY